MTKQAISNDENRTSETGANSGSSRDVPAAGENGVDDEGKDAARHNSDASRGQPSVLRSDTMLTTASGGAAADVITQDREDPSVTSVPGGTGRISLEGRGDGGGRDRADFVGEEGGARRPRRKRQREEDNDLHDAIIKLIALQVASMESRIKREPGLEELADSVVRLSDKIKSGERNEIPSVALEAYKLALAHTMEELRARLTT